MIQDIDLTGNIFSDKEELDENDKDVLSFNNNQPVNPIQVAENSSNFNNKDNSNEGGENFKINPPAPLKNSTLQRPTQLGQNNIESQQNTLLGKPDYTDTNIFNQSDTNISQNNFQSSQPSVITNVNDNKQENITNVSEVSEENTNVNYDIIKDNLLNEINSVEEKIKQLSQEIAGLSKSDKEQFYELVDNDYNTENIEEVQVVTGNNKNNYNRQIQNNINNLSRQKEKLLNELNKIEAGNISRNSTYNAESNNSFTPNFINTNAEEELYTESTNNIENNTLENNLYNSDSIKKAVFTEKILGGEPKVVHDDVLGDVVIDKKQGTVENAIKEHGGIESAIKDSINNQNIVNQEITEKVTNDSLRENNTSQEAFTHVFNNNNTTLNESELNGNNSPNVSLSNDTVNTNIPDASTSLNINSGEIIGILGKILLELGKINTSVLNSNKNNTKSSVDQNKTHSKSGDLNNNATNSQPSPPMATPKSETSDNLSSKLKDTYPLEQDFPPGMDLSQLGGRNL